MSDKNPKLFGKNLAKSKKLARLANLRGKTNNSANVSASSAELTVETAEQDVSIENVRSVVNANVSHTNTPQEIPSPNTLSDGSPFHGFGPQEDLAVRVRDVARKCRKLFFLRSDAAQQKKVSPNVRSVSHSNDVSARKPCLSSEGSDFLGFTPEIQHVQTSANWSDGSDFLGFSPQVSVVPPSLIDGSDIVDAVPEVILRRSTSALSDSRSFPASQLQEEFSLKRTSIDFESDPVYGKDIQMTPILSKRKSVTFPSLLNSPSMTAVDEVFPENLSEPPPPVRPFFKIVHGNFCQFSARFKYPHHQCAAMSAIALAYNALKSVENWDAHDIDTILREGDIYYRECLEHWRLEGEEIQNGLLEAVHLKKNLTIGSQNAEIEIDMAHCAGGPHTAENLKSAVERFEMNNFVNGILTYNDKTYALLRYKSTVDNTFHFVFFDSHGRQRDGNRVKPEQVRAGKAAILFFHNANDFIHFFLQQFPPPPDLPGFNLNRNLMLTPLHFIFQQNALPPIAEPNIRTDIEIEDVPNIAMHSQRVTRENDGISFEIIHGDSSEYDGLRMLDGQHHCCGIVIFSFVYSTLHLITSWNVEDFSAILDYGFIFYRNIHESEVNDNPRYDPSCVLFPIHFEGDLQFENNDFTVSVADYFEDRMREENIVESIRYLKSFQNAYGVLNICDSSYGITILRMEPHCQYAFFDSHGRNDDGSADGEFCSVLFFHSLNDLSHFLYANFHSALRFSLYPVQLQRSAELSSPLFDPQQTNLQYDTVNSGNFNDRPFRTIVHAAGIESDIRDTGHTFCLALSITALSSAYANGVESLTEDDLKLIHENGILYFSVSNERAIEANRQVPLDIYGYCREFIMEDREYYMCLDDISQTRHIDRFKRFENCMRYFESSIIFDFAIIKIHDAYYGICKCKSTGNIVFFDAHGRTEDGLKPGNYSAAIFFANVDQLIEFMKRDNHSWIDSTVQFVRFTPDDELKLQSKYVRFISGSFAQNDLRFGVKSRNTQCTANSVVFLASASVIENEWTNSDVDAILELGDHIYTVSFAEAIAIRPRNHTLLAADEVRRNIFVNIPRFDRGVINVKCEPLQNCFNGRFGRDAQEKLDLFFKDYNYGVFICRSLSVALYKFEEYFVLFDPHARSSEGKLEPNQTAKIFFFASIPLLFQFLSLCDYGNTREFTLTPFIVTHSDENLRDRRKNVSAPSHRPVHVIESNAEDSFDDIPIRESDEWSSSDNIPLNELKDSSDDSDNVPLIHLIRNNVPSNKNSVPPPASLKSKAEKDRDKKRNKRKNARQSQKQTLLTPEDQNHQHRWKMYLQRNKRTNAPNIYESYDEYVQWFHTHRDDGSDDEIVEAAVNAQKEHERVEQTRLLRLQNTAAIGTHFLAFGNHEEIDETDPKYALYKLSPMDQTCPHCGALYFKEECNSNKLFRTCCNFGQIHSELPQNQARNYPHILRDLLLNQSPLSRHFLDNILLYNNVLSFASLGTTTVHHMRARGSLGPVIAMEGIIYHIAEHFHTNSTGDDMPTAQLYYIDTSVAVLERQNRSGTTLNLSLLRSLENFMRANNPLAAAYRMLKNVLDEVNRRPNVVNTDVHLQIVRNRDQIRIRQNHGGDFVVPTSNEVAVVYTHLPAAHSKNIIVFPMNQTPEQGIPLASHDPNRDAMMYPILFPFSEQTWSYTLRRRTKEEVAALNAPQEEEESEVETTESEPENEPESEPEDDGRESRRRRQRVRITVREFFTFLLMIRVAFSPLLNAGKLTQQFIIDAYSRAQENTFEYLESDRGQAQIRAETYGALKDYVDRKKVFQPDLPGKLIVMPNDIVGSRQYMKQRYADALAMVARYGKPTFFITMTCNPTWEEITKNIPRGTNPIDRSDVVARVFRAKVKELIDDITKKQVLGRCVAYLAVIEWQKRSLPHCHLVTFNSPEDRPATDVDIDKFVSAEIPDPTKNEESQRLYEYVTTYMYHHRCDDTTRRESCRVPRKGTFSCPRHPKQGEQEDTTKPCVCYVCSKHFPHDFASKSQLIEGGYPIYRRRIMNGRKFLSSRGQEIDNRWIVPYNPYLLLKYNCHINVEITSSLKSIKYLFKYLHKGLDMARLNVSVVDNVQVYNEFEHFVDCRYLSAGEAVWKLFDFDMFYQSHTVYSLPVHLENYQNVIFHADNPAGALERADSHLTAYFELNRVDERARQFFYSEIPLYYVFNKSTKKWTWRKRRHEKTLSRLYTVNYNKVELYSLRLLLLTVKGALSYEHLRNVDGIQYDTFREAATALGLLDGDELLIQTFEEIVDVELPYRIRCLFANMLLFNSPTDPLAIWEQFKNRMFEDYVRKGCSDQLAENLALRHISYMLRASDKSNSEFLLPEPTFPQGNTSELDLLDDDTLINLADEAVEGQRSVGLLSDEQRVIFNEIMDSVNNPNDTSKHRLFFVDGPGGSGKTFLFSTLISIMNGMGLKVLPIAWTGIAASLLKGGRTAHSTFKLPFDITRPIACNLSTTSDLADELRTATVIVWDEISMTISYALDAVDTFFQDLMGNNLPFGGKIFVATGDFRQILPVVKGGSKFDLLNVIAKKAKVWPLLQKRSLRTNVRLTDPNDVAFAQFLLNVGEGLVNDFPANEYFGNYVKIPPECLEENSILDRIYGTTFSSDSVENFSRYGIMTTLNEDVTMLNNEIYKRMTEDVPTEHTYLSTDSVIGLDPNDDDAYDVSMLNALEPPNLPPHKLTLKQNCIVMLLCNINPAQGLCNGTRLIVTKLYRTCIRAKILNGNFKGEEVLLSRCRMTTDSIDVSCKVQRVQIPVKLGFAMTFNKAQGQSFDVAGAYIRKPPFAHGHLYVALSRARSKDKLIVQVLPDAFMGKLRPGSDDVFVPNIVYKEAL